jgi:hypothetical protein
MESIFNLMATKKISINDLKKGIFVHDLDISWMQSPFLRHKRNITTAKDILLLKKIGVKNIVIDLSRSDKVEDPLGLLRVYHA